MLKTSLLGAVICLVLMLSLEACGGGGAKTNVNASSTTMGQELMDLNASYEQGQELMDLNASYEQGLISAGEYQRAKKDVLRKYDH